jgi:hypothetical protein
MSLDLREIELAHERDASWLIALWLAIHGGDPGPGEGVLVSPEVQEGAALGAIAALSTALDLETRGVLQKVLGPPLRRSPIRAVNADVVAKRLAALGFRIAEYADDRAFAHAHAHDKVVSATGEPAPYHCTRYDGRIICTMPAKVSS